MYCGNCGREIKIDDKFCDNCGERVISKVKITEKEQNINDKIKNDVKIKKISLNKIIIFIIICILLISICLSIYNKNSSEKSLNNENLIDISLKDIQIEGISEEERKKLTKDLKDVVIEPYENYYTIERGANFCKTKLKDSTLNITENDKGYIEKYYYKYNFSSKEIPTTEIVSTVTATYSYDEKDRPKIIKVYDSSELFSISGTFYISYQANNYISKIRWVLNENSSYGNSIDSIDYQFYYKSDNNYDYIKTTYHYKKGNFQETSEDITSFSYLDNNIVKFNRGNNFIYKCNKEDIVQGNDLTNYFNRMFFMSYVYFDETELINGEHLSLFHFLTPVISKKHLSFSYHGTDFYTYNKDGFVEKSLSEDESKKTKYDYIKVDNKLLRVKTQYLEGEKNISYRIFFYDNNSMITNIIDRSDLTSADIPVTSDDAHIETFDGNSYYMYVHLTDDKMKKGDFSSDLQLIGGIWNIGQENGKFTLGVRIDLYDNIYNKIKNIDGVKEVEKTTKIFKMEDLNKIETSSDNKYLMQIFAKDTNFLNREFYTFCSNYR